ncbi:unnamed protein product [Trypanosoma congolense IL3000]|uniref:WGS project CAEQ00000000 data, annotated contig 1177 n=1 Tax=Trypanosoma congolense (strain IL3000) TaxID=1068625 RepID=F9W4F9_TRYCI|nr:unnamed protein product [Trypanosoma congolense IL3000]
MRDFICVCWLMVLFPGVTSGGDVGACELSDETARVLCTLADLLRASKHTADNYVQHYLEEPFEEVKLHKIIIDQNSELLEELLAKAVNEGKYTEKDADELESNAEGVQQVNDWGYWKAKEAVETGREYQDWAVKAANEALGEEDSSEDCSLIASLVQLIRCHVSGGKAGHTTTVFVKEVGQGANYTQRLDNRTREVLAHCNETGGDKEYCSGVGTALKAALDRWRELKEDEEEEDRGGCPDHTVWESHAHETSLHMIQLAENLALVETAAAKSLAHLSTFRGVSKGCREP